MSRDNDKVNHVPKRPRVVDTKVKWRVEDELINAVITAAVWSTERKPGTWQKMIEAVLSGCRRDEGGHRQCVFLSGHGEPSAGGVRRFKYINRPFQAH